MHDTFCGIKINRSYKTRKWMESFSGYLRLKENKEKYTDHQQQKSSWEHEHANISTSGSAKRQKDKQPTN